METAEEPISKLNQFVVVALIGGLLLGFGIGAVIGFIVGINETNKFLNENIDEICAEGMLSPQMRGATVDDPNLGDVYEI